MAQRTVSPCRPRELASSRQKNTGDTHSAPMTNPNVIELGGASKFTFRLARAPGHIEHNRACPAHSMRGRASLRLVTSFHTSQSMPKSAKTTHAYKGIITGRESGKNESMLYRHGLRYR